MNAPAQRDVDRLYELVDLYGSAAIAVTEAAAVADVLDFDGPDVAFRAPVLVAIGVGAGTSAVDVASAGRSTPAATPRGVMAQTPSNIATEIPRQIDQRSRIGIARPLSPSESN